MTKPLRTKKERNPQPALAERTDKQARRPGERRWRQIKVSYQNHDDCQATNSIESTTRPVVLGSITDQAYGNWRLTHLRTRRPHDEHGLCGYPVIESRSGSSWHRERLLHPGSFPDTAVFGLYASWAGRVAAKPGNLLHEWRPLLDSAQPWVGQKPRPGAVNVDVTDRTRPDLVHDLDVTPWPLPDSHFTEVHAYDVVEHLQDVVRTMEEIHRVCAPGARVYITVPHFSSANSFTDPTHRHHFSARSMLYFTDEHELGFYSSARFRQRQAQIVFQQLVDEQGCTPARESIRRRLRGTLGVGVSRVVSLLRARDA